eukprot:CAMPEP_0115051598 /NCGR_PEP_ID=MMETSP0227-20121206/2438_1 /TAXON_ID=89957 /ORGANISM="Polarella glacialis, Strain CCMP 1383" /LENGTH=41 /DNA_ID= /DNA_START= /DNA_END= /DNA_ORIENTATION=
MNRERPAGTSGSQTTYKAKTAYATLELLALCPSQKYSFPQE